jgi:cobalt-zinc-cadmium resistance protein CzcA
MKSYKIKLIFFISLSFTAVFAQEALTLEESLQRALKNNLQIKSGEYEIEQFKQLKKTRVDIGKTNVMWMHGKYNSFNTDNNITFTQTIPFPTVLISEVKLGEAQTESARLGLSVTKNELIYQVRSTYLHLCFLRALKQLFLSQDSLYSGFSKASALRYQTGETNLLEKSTAELQLMEIKNQVRQNEADLLVYQTQLQVLLNSPEIIDVSEELHRLPFIDAAKSLKNPLLLFSKQQVLINQQTKKVERNKFLPDILVGYFTQSLIGYQKIGGDEVFFDRNKKFTGFQFGVSIPLWFVPQAGRAKVAYYAEASAQKKYEYILASLNGQLKQAQQELTKNEISLNYYEADALKNASLILQQAQKSFNGGDIGYVEYLQALKTTQSIRANYLAALNQYNQSVIKVKYLMGEN